MRECHAISPDGKTKISEGHCVAFNNCFAQKVLIDGKMVVSTSKIASTGSPPVGASSGGTVPLQNPPSAPARPLPKPAAGPSNIEAGFQNPAAPAGPQPGQTSPPAYSGIQSEAGKTGPAGPGTGTFPAQTTPNGPAFNPDTAYRPGNATPASQLPQRNYPDYSTQAAPRAQTTFGNVDASGGYSSGYQAGNSRSNNGFISGFASLIGGLFSVPTNSVVTYIQSFVGSPKPTPATPPPAQTQPVIVQNIVLASNTLIAPPSSDILAQILAIGNQQDKNLPSTEPRAVTVGSVTPVSTASPQPPTPNAPATTPAPVSNSETTPAKSVTKSVLDLLPDEQISTISDTKKTTGATSTESTSSPRWIEPTVVEVGVPVDITDPASYESILAYINGDWTHALRTTVQNKAALAQAESERTSIIAHIESLQEAREAGICDDMCLTALSALQRDLPQWQSRVDALQKTVREGAEPSSVPPPTVGQIGRVAESLAEPAYEAPILPAPHGSRGAPAVVSVASQEIPQTSDEVKGEAAILRIVRSIWDFLKSWFLPSPQAQASQERCSLFLSLFGKCK